MDKPKRRRGKDRRRSPAEPVFPLALPGGERVEVDRRSGADRRRLGHLARQAFFRDIPFETLESLARFCDVRQLAPGELLLSPGEHNHNLYLLLDGGLTVHIDRPDGEAGLPIQPGECTGEISIIDGKPASAYVVAAAQSAVAVVPEERFWGDFMATPEIARNFMRLIADRFRSRNDLMQRALEERLRYEHLQKELDIAHEIQLGMLPHDIDLSPECDIVARMTPARQIGGDFYDVFPTSGDEYCIAIGDVAGKGIPAALFMVRTMTLLRGEMLKQQPLEEAMRRLNAALCKDNGRCMFVTLVVGLLDRHTGLFRYAVAGHNPVIHAVAGEPFGFLPRPSGILAGVAEEARYATAELQLAAGDVLVLYTDGITEAMNKAGQLFSEARLLASLDQAPGRSAHGISEALEQAVADFVGLAPQSDDLTLVALRYLGAGAG